MSIDLEQSLAAMARTVDDGAVADRLNGQVHRMVTRIRRRRVARYTATGLVSVGAVAAVVVTAVQQASRDDGPDVVPATEGTEAAWPGCGEAAPTDATNDPALVLVGTAGPTVRYGEPVPLTLSLLSMLSSTLIYDTSVDVVILDDGVVVGTATGDVAQLGVVAGTDAAEGSAVVVVACSGDTPLGEGDYQLVARTTVRLYDSTPRTATSEPLPFTITPVDQGPIPSEAEDTAGLAAVDEIVATAPDRAGEFPFPVCGSMVPTGDDPPLTLTLDLEAGTGLTYDVGSPIEAQATLMTTRGRAVLANAASPTTAQVVLTKEGVVVGREVWDTEDLEPVDLGPADSLPLPASGRVVLCGLPYASEPEAELPRGVYQAYAVMEVLLQEVTEADGEAWSVPESVAVRSEPVDVIVSVPSG